MNGAWRLPKGSYTYEASLFGYETAAGSLTVTGENDSLHVTLQQAARHSVRIATVKADDGNTLSGADITVTHAEGGEQTAVNGVYSLPDGTYSYAVMLDGYLNVAGSFTVAGKDLTVTVRLEEGSNVWTGKASDTAPETKTENGVTWYLIKTPEELAWFAAKVNRWGGIGKYSAQFGGILDGNGKTISGYYSCDNNATYESASALSGYLGADGVIKNVTLVGMIEGNGAIGAFANQSYGRIEGCVSRVNVTNAASYGGVTGGIAARVYASGAIVNCGNEGSVTCTLSSAYSDAKVGGIVGASYAPITGCYNTGAINGGSNNRGYVGGIVGYTESPCAWAARSPPIPAPSPARPASAASRASTPAARIPRSRTAITPAASRALPAARSSANMRPKFGTAIISKAPPLLRPATRRTASMSKRRPRLPRR